MPLFSEEAFFGIVVDLLRADNGVVVWWGAWIECAVAISRFRREGELDEEGQEVARAVLNRLAENWTEQRPENDVRLLAMLISKQHPLKAADCLQLAAALRWCEGGTNGAGFVCLDERLRDAAVDEGFYVLPEPPDEEGDP